MKKTMETVKKIAKIVSILAAIAAAAFAVWKLFDRFAQKCRQADAASPIDDPYGFDLEADEEEKMENRIKAAMGKFKTALNM